MFNYQFIPLLELNINHDAHILVYRCGEYKGGEKVAYLALMDQE